MDPLSALPGVRVETDGAARTPVPRQVGAVAEQFEAIFLRQLLRDLRKTATIDAETSTSTSIYQDLFDEHLADQLARAGGVGLAGVIRAYLERRGR